MIYLTLLGGIAVLCVCGDVFVRGAVALAVKLNIPTMIIGLTIVSFGTSAPELLISLRAAFAGYTGIAIGNVVGSNIANVLLVLGIPALVCSTDCDQPLVRRNTLYVLAASLIFIWLCFYGPLTVWHGTILLVLMAAFLAESWARANKTKSQGILPHDETDDIIESVSQLSGHNGRIYGFILIGLVGLPIGAHLTVQSASDIAMAFGVSEAVIGLTVVAFGTSLPELVTTLSAALRGQSGLALGNVLGSNLFNILAIMGLASLVAPIAVPDVFLQLDLWVMFAASLAIALFVFNKMKISRLPGILFVLAYLSYIYFVFMPRMADMASLSQ